MNTNFTKFISFLPLKINALFFTIVLFIAVYFIKTEFVIEDTYNFLYLELFAWLVGSFVAIIIGVGFLHTLACYLHFVINRKNSTPKIEIGLNDSIKGEAGKVPVLISLPKAWLPLLGFIKIKIEFENGKLSETIVINKFSKGFEKLQPKEGATVIWLPDRKQYHAKGFIISFIDYLEFFRFTLYKKTKNGFYLHSSEMDIAPQEINPSKTKEELQKIKTSRKIEGDFLNYKDFESGDDVRGIVWKIFAKNRELVIRTPEVINPYASHIKFHTSFYNLISRDLTSAFATSMLNYFKDVVYNICLSIQKTDKKVEFTIDQEINEFISVHEKDRVGFQLSAANWQNDRSVTDAKISGESIVCISTLISIEELTTLIEKKSLNIFIVKVSRHLDHQNLFNFKNLFLRTDEKSELNKLAWFASATRKKVKKNEKAIEELIANSNFVGQII